MFSEPRVNVIQSDVGYSVQVHGMNGLEYREGDTSVFIMAEVGGKGSTTTIGIWRDSIRFWSSPRGSRPVTEDERIKILERIRAALKWKSTEIEIS